MDKQKEDLLKMLGDAVNSGVISKEELNSVSGGASSPNVSYSENVPVNNAPIKEGVSEKKNVTAINILYAIGGVIALIGIFILVLDYWNEIGFIGRAIVTLGASIASGVVAYKLKSEDHRALKIALSVIAVLLAPVGIDVITSEYRNMTILVGLVLFVVAMLFNGEGNAKSFVSQFLYILSSSTIPLGVFVIFDNSNIFPEPSTLSVIYLVLALVYGFSYFVHRMYKREILVLISAVFLGSAYFVYTVGVLNLDYTAMRWATFVLAFAYLLFNYGYKIAGDGLATSKVKRFNVVLIDLVGTCALLFPMVSFEKGIMDVIAIAIIFGVIYGSLFIKSKTMLLVGVLFLAGHIIKLTAIYFAGTVGWPVSLIVVGIIIIAIGYMTLRLNRKYLSGSAM